MSEKQDKISCAVKTMEAYGYKLPEALAAQVCGLANPHYRVAVVGKFQVGKSALLNRVFLGGNPILAEGEGLCTTAVATDITYGPVKKLSAYHVANDENQTERLVSSKENPSKEDLWNATVANKQDSRSELAKKVSRVVLEEPNEHLKGYTIIDTPGLDDPEQELLFNTTFRIIPNTDVALVIVEAKMLDTIVTNFLRNELFGKNGFSRMLMLVSYRPGQDLDEDQRKDILDTIKAQLAGIGRDNIQVEMYCFDPSVEDIMCDVAEIRLAIRSFLNENALPGREEKVTNLIRAELEKMQVELAAKIKSSGTTAEEKTRLRARLNHEVEQFKMKCEGTFRKLQGEVQGLRDEVVQDVDMAVNASFDGFYLQLENCDTVDAMKKVLSHAETMVKADLSQRVSVIGMKVQTNLCAVLAKYTQDFVGIYTDWNQFLSDEFVVNRPALAKLPSIVWDALNVVVLNWILPLGWITAIAAHLIGKKFLDPTTWMVKKLILSSVRKGLDESKGEVRQRILDMIHGNVEKTFAEIKTAIETSNKEQVKAIQAGMETTAADDAEKAKFEAAKSDVDALLSAL